MDSTFGPPRLLCLIKGVVRATQPKMHSLWHLTKLLVPYVGCACASQMQILVLIDKKIEVLALSEQISLWHVGNGLSSLMMQKMYLQSLQMVHVVEITYMYILRLAQNLA